VRTKKPKTLKQRQETFIKAALRRASLRWEGRNQAFVQARIKRGLYKCADCGDGFKRNQVQLDHIDPVIDIKLGSTNWDDYINRLLPDVSGFQVLCENCHDNKTRIEDELRVYFAQKRKKLDK